MAGHLAHSRPRHLAVRVIYRLRQVWETIGARPDAEGLATAQRLLPPPLWELFRQMPPHEQAHALRVFRRLQRQGHHDHALLCAALLHDVGKALEGPRLWERVAAVLAHACCPAHAARWGKGQPHGWRRPFVIARQHPEWGARLAAKAGASMKTVALIRHHHTIPPPADLPGLAALQAADDQE